MNVAGSGASVSLAARLAYGAPAADVGQPSAPPAYAGDEPASTEPRPPLEDGGRGQWPTRYAELEESVSVAEDYFAELGRQGWNGKGDDITIVVWGDYNNAASFYNDKNQQSSILVGQMSGNWLTDDTDVVVHEYAHSVIAEEVRDEPGHPPKAPTFAFHAINEGLADVMAAGATGDWNIAHFRTLNRDETGTGPGVADGKDAVATDLRHLRETISAEADMTPKELAAQGVTSTEPHYASGIVSNAAAEVQRKLGWDKMSSIFYGVIANPAFDLGTDFRDVAALAIDEAEARYGAEAATVVEKAFADNRVRPTPPTEAEIMRDIHV